MMRLTEEKVLEVVEQCERNDTKGLAYQLALDWLEWHRWMKVDPATCDNEHTCRTGHWGGRRRPSD